MRACPWTTHGGYAVPPTMVNTIDSRAYCAHAQYVRVPARLSETGLRQEVGPSNKEAVRIRTRALQAQIIWIRLWQECHSASGRSGDQQITDLGQGWASKHPQNRAVSCPATLSPVKGLAAPAGWAVVGGGRGGGKEPAGHPVAPSSQSWRLGQACGQLCDLQRGPRDRTAVGKSDPWRIDPSDVCESESQGSEVAHEAG